MCACLVLFPFRSRASRLTWLACAYRFCGLTRAQQSSALTVLRSDAPNWVYQYTNPAQPGKWTQILPEVVPETSVVGRGGEHGYDKGRVRIGRGEVGGQGESLVPLPRYAHQVVYDERTKKVYMHGGNAGEGRGLGGEEKENDEARVSSGTGGGARGGEAEGGGGDGTEDGNWAEGEAGREEERPRPGLRETRLDDFWVMDLVRCVLAFGSPRSRG